MLRLYSVPNTSLRKAPWKWYDHNTHHHCTQMYALIQNLLRSEIRFHYLSASALFSWEPNSGLTLDTEKEESSRKCWFQCCDFILSRLPHWVVRPIAQHLLCVFIFVCCWKCPALVWRPHDTHVLLSEEETTSSCLPELWKTRVIYLKFRALSLPRMKNYMIWLFSEQLEQ